MYAKLVLTDEGVTQGHRMDNDVPSVCASLVTELIVGAASSSLIVPTPVTPPTVTFSRFHLARQSYPAYLYRDREACYTGWNNQVPADSVTPFENVGVP